MNRKDFSIHAAPDLHCGTTVMAALGADGSRSRPVRFATTAENLVERVRALGGASVALTLEASPLSRWAAKLLRPHVGRLVVCDPRKNRLTGKNPNKRDESDADGLCVLLQLGHLKEVWVGEDRDREILRHLAREMLDARDACREAKAHIKARFHGWGVLGLAGKRLFDAEGREGFLERLPGPEEARMMRGLYGPARPGRRGPQGRAARGAALRPARWSSAR